MADVVSINDLNDNDIKETEDKVKELENKINHLKNYLINKK